MESEKKFHRKLGAPNCRHWTVLLFIIKREHLELDLHILNVSKVELYDKSLVRKIISVADHRTHACVRKVEVFTRFVIAPLEVQFCWKCQAEHVVVSTDPVVSAIVEN